MVEVVLARFVEIITGMYVRASIILREGCLDCIHYPDRISIAIVRSAGYSRKRRRSARPV
jgi:hypothetical protein